MVERAEHESPDPSRPLTVGPTSARLLDALRANNAEDVSDELREAVCEYVGLMKAEGRLAEHIVILLNRAMTSVGIDKGGLSHGRLGDSVIQICVKEFYRSP